MKKNRYSRALNILKSTEVDDKIRRLDEAPTNRTSGLYSLNQPGFRLGDKDPRKVYYPAADGTWPEGIPGTPGELEYVRPKGYWSGGSDWDTQISTDFSQDYLESDPTGRSTSGLIGEDGTVFSELPPDSQSFILGPVIDGFVPNHTSDAYTNIGYLQKDTRQFVLLARIRGQWKDGLNGSGYPVWNGTSTGLTIYNENMTLEMVQWIRDQIIADNYVSKVPYFYSGGVPQVPQSPADCPNCPPNMYGGNGIAPRQFGEGGEPSIGTQQVAPRSGDAEDAGFPWEIARNVDDIIRSGQLPYGLDRKDLYKIINYPHIDPKMQRDAQRMWIELMKQASGYQQGVEVAQQWTDDPSTWPSIKNPVNTPPPIIDPKTGWPTVPNVPPTYRGTPSGSPVRLAHFNPKGRFISENLKGVKSLIREQEVAQTTQTTQTTQSTQSTTNSRPLDPRWHPQAYQQQDSTGAGRVGSYAEGQKLFSWLQQQGTDLPGGKGFITGYLSGHSLPELEKIFLGTTVSARTVNNLSNQVEKYDQESTELNLKAIEVWNEVEPQINAGIDRMRSANSAKNWGAFYSALNEVDRLFALSYTARNNADQASSRYINSIIQLGSYVINGKFLPKDPFQLDDPTVARSQQERKKRDEEIRKQIEELNKAASDSKQAAQLNKLKALGMGALLAGAIVLGAAVLAKPAIVAALGSATIRSIKGLLGLSDDVLKGTSSSTASETAKMARNFQRQNPGKYNPFLSDKANQLARQQGVGTNVKGQNPAFRDPLKNSYEPSGKVLSESRKRILREIKQPYKLPEQPKQKYKMNFSGKYSPQNTPDKTASRQSDELVASGNARGQRWRLEDHYWQGYETTERMNIIQDRIGHGQQAWDMLVNENKNKKAWRDKKIQEHLNIIAHEKAMINENPEFQSPFRNKIEEQETIQADKDPLFKKVTKRLKKEIDYQDKPSKNGDPNEPPPEMVNGYHPQYGKRKDYYKKLDPQSAAAMPETGDPEIDAQVRAARKKPK